MRSSSTSSRSRRLSLATFACACACACSSTPATPDAGATPQACIVELTGNVYGASQVAPCANVAQNADAGGDWILTIDTGTPDMSRVLATIDLGTSPSPGLLTSETVETWDTTALGTTNCAFQAGDTEVPTGSFTLQLTSFDAKTATAHGTLAVVAYVHAPPMTNCNDGDTQNISIQF